MTSKAARQAAHKNRVQRRQQQDYRAPLDMVKTVLSSVGMELDSRQREDGETVYFISEQSRQRNALAEDVAVRLNMSALDVLMTFSNDEMQAIIEVDS